MKEISVVDGTGADMDKI